MNKKLLLSALLVVLISMTFVSCAKKQGKGAPIGEQELPDMIMHGATYIFGEKNIRPLVMEAREITMYSGDNARTLLEGVEFSQEEEDDNGVLSVELEGSCDSAHVNGDNNIAQLKGHVRLTKKSNNFEIDCENLFWDDVNQIIKTDDEIHVVYEDGTELTAIGFYAQLDDNNYEFGRIVEGRFSNEE